VRTSSGTALHDATAGTGAVAVVISPGPVLTRLGGASQDRGCAGDANQPLCVQQGICSGVTTPRCNPVNYLVPLNSQIQSRRISATRERLAEAKEALLAYLVSNGRLPCPASTGSNGKEAFDTSALGTETNGICSAWDGLLPAVTLGMSGLDAEGYAVDAWGGTANRIRYAVSNTTVNTIPNPFTSAGGMRSATIAEIGQTPVPNRYLTVCASSAGVTASDCGTAVPLADGSAIAIVYSLGGNGAEVASGALTPAADEAENRDGDVVFISHEPTDVTGAEYDDFVDWIGGSLAMGRMVQAGRRP
jgi:hypothetical protein